jgi:alkylhydroperoxidase family enzyme
VDINSAVGRKAGVTDAKLQAVLGDSLNAFSEIERAVIELADALTSTPSNVSDELYAKLREHFSEEQLLELSAQIAFENYRARLNRLYNAESDGLYRSEAVAA